MESKEEKVKEASFISLNLKYIRKELQLTQEGMAKVLEVKRGTLASYEEGRAEPSISTLVKISKWSRISIDTLLTWDLSAEHKFMGYKNV